MTQRFWQHRTWTIALIVGCTWLAAAACCQAHFLWADVEQRSDGTPEARFYFGELPRPGEVELLDKITQTKAWSRGADGRTADLKLTRSTAADQAALVAPLESVRLASVEATCDYGLHERGTAVLLLQYYAKHLLGDWPHQDKLTRADKLQLDIVPDWSSGTLDLQVLFAGKPDPEREVIVIDPSGKQHELKTDDEGRVAMTIHNGGPYAVRAAHVEAERGGKLAGKEYSQTWHYCTLTLDVPSPPAGADDISAADLLAKARAARSLWQRFSRRQRRDQHRAGWASCRWTRDDRFGGRRHCGRGRCRGASRGPPKRSNGWHSIGCPMTAARRARSVMPTTTWPIRWDARSKSATRPQASPCASKGTSSARSSRKTGPAALTISVLEVSRDADNKVLPRLHTANLSGLGQRRAEKQPDLSHRVAARGELRVAQDRSWKSPPRTAR